MKSIGERIFLFFLFFQVSLRKIWEEAKVRKRFYGNDPLRASDLALKEAYRGINPYKISKQFLIQKGEQDVDVYGETPLTTLAQIAKECRIGPNDTLVELGAGRGRGAFFLSHWTGCKVVAIEWIPSFVAIANKIKDLCSCKSVSFHCEDIAAFDFSSASFIYLCGTCFDDGLLQAIAKKLDGLKKGASVITVSFPISDYSSSFQLKKQFKASFFWGKTEIYLQEKQ